MDFELTQAQREWRDEVRAFLAENVTAALREELLHVGAERRGQEFAAFRRKVGEKGWYGLNWPVEYGGLGRSATEQHILIDEFNYANVPGPDLTVTSVAPMIMRYGTQQNKEEFLPGIARGEITVAVGYSEPDAGTDLASLQTRAELDGDEWVINGSKIWNSLAHQASHEWLCVRTDPAAPKHHGISVIMVPISTPGIEIRPLITWADFRTNQTFFTDVRVPRGNLIGEVNKGWQYITGALDLERGALTNAGDLRAEVDDLIRVCTQQTVGGVRLADRPEVRQRLAELHADVEVRQTVRAGGLLADRERRHPDGDGDRGEDLYQRATAEDRRLRHADPRPLRPARLAGQRGAGRRGDGAAVPDGAAAALRRWHQRGAPRRHRPARLRDAELRPRREPGRRELLTGKEEGRMRVSLTQEQADLAETVRHLLTRECTPELVRKLQASDSLTEVKELWDALTAIGVFGLAVPEQDAAAAEAQPVRARPGLPRGRARALPDDRLLHAGARAGHPAARDTRTAAALAARARGRTHPRQRRRRRRRRWQRRPAAADCSAARRRLERVGQAQLRRQR